MTSSRFVRFGWSSGFAAGALCALLVSCAPAGEAPEVEDPPLPRADATADTTAAPAQAVPGAERPETRRDTIMLEGMPEPVTLRLFRTPGGFPLPFSTYFPEDMIAEVTPSGEEVRFVAAFGGQRNDSAFVAARVYPEGATEEEARARLRAALGGAVERASEPAYGWGEEEYVRQGAGTVGRGVLGRHAGRLFHVVVRYPAEYGDGFGPRAGTILDEWRWGDGGEPLGR